MFFAYHDNHEILYDNNHDITNDDNNYGPIQ